jgi:hypothetical protein
MALQKTFTQTQAPFSGSLEIADAYWRVEQVIATKSEAQCVVTINKKDGNNLAQVSNKRYSFAPNLTGKNFIAQAYDYLKTLPEFAGATDC